MRNDMKCKGKKDVVPCGSVICQTDGKSMFVRDESGLELKITPRKGSSVMAITCTRCGFDNLWGKHIK